VTTFEVSLASEKVMNLLIYGTLLNITYGLQYTIYKVLNTVRCLDHPGYCIHYFPQSMQVAFSVASVCLSEQKLKKKLYRSEIDVSSETYVR